MSHLGMGSKTEGEGKKKVSQRFIIQKFENPEIFAQSVSAELSQEVKLVKDSFQSVQYEVVSEAGLVDRSWLNQKPREDSENESASPGSDQMQQFNTGRWTEIEHKKFLEAILMYGNEWKRVQQYISTRSSTQARSHAQKFFLRLKKSINISGVFDEEHIEFFRALGENRKKNNKYDSILKFLTDYSKHGQFEYNNLTLDDTNGLSEEQRQKLINIVLNFTKNYSKKKPTRSSKKIKLKKESSHSSSFSSVHQTYTDDDESDSQKTIISRERKSNLIFHIKKVKRKNDRISENENSNDLLNLNENKEYLYSIQQLNQNNSNNTTKLNNLGRISTFFVNNKINYQANFLAGCQSTLSNKVINNSNYYYGNLNFPNNQEKNIHSFSKNLNLNLNDDNLIDVFQEDKKSGINLRELSSTQDSPLMRDNETKVLQSFNSLSNDYLGNKSLNPEIFKDNQQKSLYDELKCFFNNKRKFSENKSTSKDDSLVSSRRESQLLNFARREEIFSDKNFITKKSILNLTHLDEIEDYSNNPFSLNFDAGPFSSEMMLENLYTQGESTGVESDKFKLY